MHITLEGIETLREGRRGWLISTQGYIARILVVPGSYFPRGVTIFNLRATSLRALRQVILQS